MIPSLLELGNTQMIASILAQMRNPITPSPGSDRDGDEELITTIMFIGQHLKENVAVSEWFQRMDSSDYS